MHPKKSGSMVKISTDKKIEIHGTFDIEGTVSNLLNFLSTRDYAWSEKDRGQCNEAPNRELITYYDCYRFIDDTYKNWMSFSLNFSGRDVEVVENGVKKVKSQGKAKLVVTTYIEVDWQGKLKGDKVGVFFTKLYNHFHGEHAFFDVILENVFDCSDLCKVFKKSCGSKFV